MICPAAYKKGVEDDMSGSVFGDIFKISTWGESHGRALGVVIDGCPAGISLAEPDFEEAMARRAPGRNRYATPRKESDTVEILSGVFEGRTTGTPISLMIKNTSQRSADYSEIAGYYRPGHADRTFDEKYGFRDYRGGGRSSGRETAARVAAGVVAAKLLDPLGISVVAYVKQIGEFVCKNNIYMPPKEYYGTDERGRTVINSGYVPEPSKIAASPLMMPDTDVSNAAEEYLNEQMKNGDSVGAMIECVATGVPGGLGDPVFDKLDAGLAGAIMSIGAVKGVEIGAGFGVTLLKGSENNSPENAGGVFGGISDGGDIVIRAAVKPTPSISVMQRALNRDGEMIDISVKGRHDPIIAPRAVVVVESMVNLVLADKVLKNMTARFDRITEFYNK